MRDTEIEKQRQQTTKEKKTRMKTHTHLHKQNTKQNLNELTQLKRYIHVSMIH